MYAQEACPKQQHTFSCVYAQSGVHLHAKTSVVVVVAVVVDGDGNKERERESVNWSSSSG